MTKKTEKTEIKDKITIPDQLHFTLENNVLTIKGEKGQLSRDFTHPQIEIKVNSRDIEIKSKSTRRKEKALVGTVVAHIRNMIKGVTEGFEYKMKTVFFHFPIKTSVDGNDFVIQNFLGERSARRAKILDGVDVEIKGEDIIVRGIDKEKVGQTVANIERATLVKNRDIRVFQDGIYKVIKGAR
ncbi:MAG: 50S ribosomal protein L6 [Thermoplasmatota archaeon]|jgi:large subunit ribosomal protein L6